MAKRSDFAQKLLDDLRLRKERMAVSQSSNGSSMISGATFSWVHDQTEKYGNTAQVYKGYRETKPRESMSLGTQSMQKRSAHGINRSQTRKETSNQIVTLGRCQRPEQIGDLTLALAFALENGGKYKGMESSGNSSIISFLRHIGWRSVETVNIDRRNKLDRYQTSTSFPTLSHFHLQEISRGAQKLNQILRACSSGINIDRHSIEIGKELLKGAMELEESLRMLVNLQEASEFMISPHSQRKNRIRLLDADEDDDESSIGVVEQKQVTLPRFSFDKPSRNLQGTQEATKAGSNQNIMALTYPTAARATSNNLQKHALVPLNSFHKHSLSSGPDLRTLSATTAQKEHCGPSPKEDKGRIPNVIAKLMGLDELPQKRHSKNIGQTELSSRKVTEQMVLKTTASRTTKNDEIKKVTEDLATQKLRQNGVQNKRVPVTLSKVLELQADENQVKESTTLKSTVQYLESTEGTKLVAGSKKETLKRNKQTNSKIPLTIITGNQEDKKENEKKRETVKLNERKGMEVARPVVQVLKGELQEIESWQPITEPANAMRELTGKREHMLQTEKRNVNRIPSGNQQKTNKDLAFQQPQVLRNSEPQEEEHQKKEAEQKSKHHVRRQKGIEGAAKFLPKLAGDAPNFQKKLLRLGKPTAGKTGSREGIRTIPFQGAPNSINQNIAKDLTATDQVGKNDTTHRDMDENNLAVNLKAESERNKASFPTVIKLKSAHLFPTNQKVNNIKANKNEIPQKIAEVMTRKPGSLRITSSLLKHHLPNVPATKQKKHDKTSSMKDAEKVTTTKSRATEAFIRSTGVEESDQQSDSGHNLHKEAEQPHTLSHAREDDHIPATLAEDKHFTNARSSISSDPQVQALLVGKEQVQRCQENRIVLAIDIGTLEESFSSKLKHKLSRTEVQEPLTEDENHLRQILIKSQLFLDTAEALFKLNIPGSILHASIDSCQDEEGKILLDCAYEIMKRKGRLQELAVHPFVKIPFGSSKVRSLEDLVKQLHKDFEVLKAYRSNGNNEGDTIDYLHEMLERDAQDRYPDTNTLWDFGWNQMMKMFLEKDEVARNVERHILNELLDEVTTGFLRVSISS
ncbi:DUF3741-associated sequence motif [Dillenia turbinata]|uniref:DUF3741-associated sequence motif n=1 Tax=Dillenia turbinata TaxID=194707 RepID=A0AAN8VPJ4_9MAGN